jgi:hypothetical protein
MSWCLQRKNVELFLVYELVPNGNLHQHLHEGEEVLPWERRYLLTFLMATSISFIFSPFASIFNYYSLLGQPCFPKKPW